MTRLWVDPRNWPVGLACVLLWAAVRILPIGVLQALGRGVARVARPLMRQRAAVARRNLEACFPQWTPAEQSECLHHALDSAGVGLVESSLALWGSPERLRQHTRVSGLDQLDGARQGGRGVLVLMAHYTMVELACRLANEFADPGIVLLGRRNNQPLLDALIDRARRRHAPATLEKKDLKGLLKALKSGQAVFYAPDQNFTYNSVFAPFFGIPAATVTATADIVRRSGASLVPLWCHRDDAGLYQLEFQAPWRDYPSGDPQADAARVNAWIEKAVRRHPDQYLWIHRRFKTRPDGEPAFYPPQARRAKDR